MTQSQLIQRLKRQHRMGNLFDDLGKGIGTVKALSEVYISAKAAMASAIKEQQTYLTGLEKTIAVNQVLTDSFNTLIDRSLLFEKRNATLNKSFGIATAQAAAMSQQLAKVAKATGLNNEQTKKYATNIKKIVPTLDLMTKANTKSYQGMLAVQKVLTTNVGLTDQAAEGFAYYAGQTGKNAVVQLKTTQGITDAIDKATGMQGSFKDVTEEIAKASAATQLQFGRMPGNLEMAAIKGKALGFTLDEMTSIGTKMLDIESSIGAELEYQLLSGNRLVDEVDKKSLTNKFREAALAGDANKQAAALNTILEQEGNTLQNNVLARQQMAKLLGMEESKLARALQKKKLLEEMGADKKLFELGGDELKKALQAQVDAGKMSAAQMKEVVKISDTRTTDQRIDESNKYLEDIRMYTFMSTKQQDQIVLNSLQTQKGAKDLNKKLLASESDKPEIQKKLIERAKLIGEAQIISDYPIKSDVASIKTAKVDIVKQAEKVGDLLFLPGMGTKTGGYGDLFSLDPRDGVMAGPPEALQAAANGGSSIDYDKLARAMSNVKLEVTIDPIATGMA